MIRRNCFGTVRMVRIPTGSWVGFYVDVLGHVRLLADIHRIADCWCQILGNNISLVRMILVCSKMCLHRAKDVYFST